MSDDTGTMSDEEQQRRRAMVAEHMPQTPFISLLGQDGSASDVATSLAQP